MVYDRALMRTFYLPLALTCLGLVGVVGMEWRSVKKKKMIRCSMMARNINR